MSQAAPPLPRPLQLSVPPGVPEVAVQYRPSSHVVAAGSKLSTQEPEPLQVSGLLQAVLLGSPQAVAAEGITYTLDQMDSDIISRLKTPSGPLVLLPYPVVTVDMGQQLARMKGPAEIETLWVDYALELAAEARADPAREATTVVIGIHPFVVGTPDGAAAMRRVLLRLKMDDAVWLSDTDAIRTAAGLK